MSTTDQSIIRVVDGALVAGQEFQLALSNLREAARSITVTDKSSCTSGKELVKRGRDDIKAITAAAEPERARLQRAIESLRGQRDKMIAEFSAIVDPLDRKCRDYDIAEKEAAERERQRLQREAEAAARAKAEAERREAERVAAEQRKIAEAEAAAARKVRERELEEQRKAGELTKRELEKAKKLEAEIAAKAKEEAVKQEAAARELAAKQAAETAAAVPEIHVAPEIEAVSGTRFQVNYRFEVVNPSQVKAAWLIPDEKRIGQKVRSDKNPELSMKEIGGIRVYKD